MPAFSLTQVSQSLAIATHIFHGHCMPMMVNMHISTYAVFQKKMSADIEPSKKSKDMQLSFFSAPLPWQPSRLSDGHRKPDRRRGSKTLFLGEFSQSLSYIHRKNPVLLCLHDLHPAGIEAGQQNYGIPVAFRFLCSAHAHILTSLMWTRMASSRVGRWRNFPPLLIFSMFHHISMLLLSLLLLLLFWLMYFQ